ncbi:hypothetical protein CIW49_30370 [Mycolicibacterium sp. P1-18]|nr:hypothetical protein CIW49_30370 [Mycolicibacterium sp. P1-18]
MSVAATIVVIGSVFAAGFAAGSEHGGTHHHRGGHGHSQSDGGRHDGDYLRRSLDGRGEPGGG